MNNNRTGASFPWANTELLAEALRTGEITLPMAISQIAAVDRESLKIIEDSAGQWEKFYKESRAACSKNEKLIDDLTEKCQAMHQAMLYKDEQLQELSRQVARYKVICEMSARAACNDDILFAKPKPNPAPSAHDDLLDFERNILNEDNGDGVDDQLKRALASQTILVPGRTSLRHAKISASQLEARKNKEKMQDLGFAEPGRSTTATGADTATATASNCPEKDDCQEANEADTVPAFPDSWYEGGPCKRTNKRVRSATQSPVAKAKTCGPVKLTLPERIRMVGGVLGPKANVSNMPSAASMFQPAASSSNQRQPMRASSVTPIPMRSTDLNVASNNTNRAYFGNSKDDASKVKVTLGGQSNEVLSSLKNISHSLKQKIVEKDLRRQVAECTWTRIARRKKEWPFD